MKELKQFKCLNELKKIIDEISALRARPVVRGQHATLYGERLEGKYRTVMGVRICDYKFSPDEKWVLPDRQMGLSFSATWTNLRFVYGMYQKREKKKPIDIYWVLSEADIPPGLEFVEDDTNPGHYFLTVTEPMRIEKLVEKLTMISHRMSVIKDGGRVL